MDGRRLTSKFPMLQRNISMFKTVVSLIATPHDAQEPRRCVLYKRIHQATRIHSWIINQVILQDAGILPQYPPGRAATLSQGYRSMPPLALLRPGTGGFRCRNSGGILRLPEQPAFLDTAAGMAYQGAISPFAGGGGHAAFQGFAGIQDRRGQSIAWQELGEGDLMEGDVSCASATPPSTTRTGWR